jgi:hypothetical protein
MLLKLFYQHIFFLLKGEQLGFFRTSVAVIDSLSEFYLSLLLNMFLVIHIAFALLTTMLAIFDTNFLGFIYPA